MGRGLLHLTVLSAKDLPRHERFGKQQCYVEVQLGCGIGRTKTCKGGQSPAWNETLFLQLQNEQDVSFRVLVERVLMKDVEIGTATLNLDQVLLNGTDEAVLALSCKGKQQGSLCVSLELRSNAAAATANSHSRGSSGSSLASPLSSASIAFSHSGSLGNSFTGPTGLKQPSLPIMLMQQPNLALYREQLLQQSAILAAQQQQQQQQQQRGQGHVQGSTSGTRSVSRASSSSSSTSTGNAQGTGSRKVQWTPRRTAVDLLADPSSLHGSDPELPDLAHLLDASSFSSYESNISQGPPVAARAPVDAARVQALMNAVYGKDSTAHAAAATVRPGQPSAAGGAAAAGLGYNSTAGGSGGLGGGAAAAAAASSKPVRQGSEVGGTKQAANFGAGHTVGPSGASRAGIVGGAGGCGGPFDAAAPHAAAAAAADAVPVVGFEAATLQAAAAAFAAAIGVDGRSVSSDAEWDAHMASGKGAAARPSSSSGGGGGGMPDPFGTGGMQAAAAAAASQQGGMPDPFGMGCWHAAAAAAATPQGGHMPDPFGAGAMAAAAAAAAAGGAIGAPVRHGSCAGAGSLPLHEPSTRPDLGVTASSGRHHPRRSTGAALQTVIECAESSGGNSTRTLPCAPRVGTTASGSAGLAAGTEASAQQAGDAATAPAQQAGDASTAHAATEQAAGGMQQQQQHSAGGAAHGDELEEQGSILQLQVADLARQLQEKDLLVQQLMAQLQQAQQQLQGASNTPATAAEGAPSSSHHGP